MFSRNLKNRRAAKSIAPPTGERTILKEENATIDDILEGVLFSHNNDLTQTKEFAKNFDFTDYNEFYRLWHYTKFGIKYQADEPYKEVIQAPAILSRTKAGDCKSKSILIGTTLANAGIPVTYELINQGKESMSHVYVVAHTQFGEIIMDSVHTRFDERPPRIVSLKSYDANTGKRVAGLNPDNNIITTVVTGVSSFFMMRSENRLVRMVGVGVSIYSAYQAYQNYQRA